MILAQVYMLALYRSADLQFISMIINAMSCGSVKLTRSRKKPEPPVVAGTVRCAYLGGRPPLFGTAGCWPIFPRAQEVSLPGKGHGAAPLATTLHEERTGHDAVREGHVARLQEP